jgi:hypothetical protein
MAASARRFNDAAGTRLKPHVHAALAATPMGQARLAQLRKQGR